MTDDELDLLASAYVDGEATPDEVALVERDPELMARVEAFRALTVDGSPTPPPGLIDRHLDAAMAEFAAISPGATDPGAPSAEARMASTPLADSGETVAPVVELGAGSARRAGRSTDRATTNGSSRPNGRARTMPSWLPAAAGFVIIGGGLIWALGQTGSSDDSADTTAAAFEATAESDTADNATDDVAAEGGDEMAAIMADDSMEESDEAMEEEAESSRVEASEDTDAAASDAAPSDDEGAADAEAELVVPAPLLFFDDLPDLDALDDLPDPEPDLELSLCGPEIVANSLGEPLGFIPVEVQDQPAEIYLFLDGDGAEIRVLVDDDCQPLEP